MNTIAPDGSSGVRIVAWVGWIAVATLAFIRPLIDLARYAVQSDLFSYIPLVPLVSGYLLYTERATRDVPYRTSLGGLIILSGMALLALAAWFTWRPGSSVNDALTLLTFAYVSVVAAGGFLFLGTKWMATAAFPMAFLIFMIPLPDAAVHWLEWASVLASADVSAFFYGLTTTPMLRDGLRFMLPGIVLEVAQECSGIRSSWVLFITSLIASHMFLKRPWHRIILVAIVIPLGIVRNAFRILVIGLLCVHIGPHMIDSAIHHQGGPLFFLLSLIPLLFFLWWLRRREQ